MNGALPLASYRYPTTLKLLVPYHSLATGALPLSSYWCPTTLQLRTAKSVVDTKAVDATDALVSPHVVSHGRLSFYHAVSVPLLNCALWVTGSSYKP